MPDGCSGRGAEGTGDGARDGRRHYSYEYAVEIDDRSLCDLTWFEKDELEALQVLVERQTG